MASSHRLLLLLSIILVSVGIAVSARPGRFHPCNTLLLITSSTSTYENPNFSLRNPSIQQEQGEGDRFLTFHFTEIRQINPRPSLRSYKPIFIDRRTTTTDRDTVVQKPFLGHLAFDLPSSSIRDRTMDIMSIVGALLFGVGCGALTAATMYLVWSLFSPHRFELVDSEDEFDDDDEEDASPKKMGYVTIPADSKMGYVTAAVPVPAPTAKEVA